MKQQIIVSGIGGQGVLFLTRVIAQVAVNRGIPVLTSETHGMAQRGGTVLSSIKVGDFASPLIRAGQADVGLLLWDANLSVHQPLLRADGTLVISSEQPGVGKRIAAAKLARDLGNAVLANLILLGLAVRDAVLFCTAEECEEAIRQLAPERFVEQNLAAFRLGLEGSV
ncbi:2-oxoacid:acceptor oxidoreductase family protein [Desulfuromonas acetoxidans]|uniref:Pyruvate ferredoxin/flavodoxin oxidoreductase n=1 Tax=Desulfuromonas acetoxidans (strain DSM 684 / 11070) TaxID=281689 RepID=Q1JXT7_DESA6|nr:2-oxoacid:acceptor oxidoreductase family protein [Desulfuromonas acetoxidans]EAT15056.1 pyruvate ferredoxin/flavodoxin oxidoreductase [Desulfuromonas acetoxidans DSM 684]MBF0647153.1 2-oxoacid:acceptor oxidoreductase family protein [Desulfuromonas acetoxidans]NVD24982.1 2-oxoacid:acceptor oxidoreductase family protein [Desulfuromonas acetoxidans]NVE15283.1 2-oxoacid:acceptor oxidoreductase family protein [Desulfuromonas acetoxidans]